MRVLVGLVFTLLCALACGAIYQAFAQAEDLERYPPPGILVQVHDHEMHLHCLGQGNPTIVMEAGINGDAKSWYLVHQRLSQLTRVCAYDRAGLGYSEPIDRPLEMAEVVADLHELLNKAGINSPLVMLGMSGGGIYARAYQKQYPTNFVGLALIESSHEQQYARMPYGPDLQTSRDQEDLELQLCSWLAPFGIVRASGLIRGMLQANELSAAQTEHLLASYNQTHICDVLRKENNIHNAEMDAMRDPPAQLGDLPLLVVSRARLPDPDDFPDTASYHQRQASEATWRILQNELAELSSNSIHLLAENSGHIVQFDQPDIVVDGIAQLLTRIQVERSLN